MFKIGEFARLNKVTVKALRYYDRLGLLKPEKIDPFTGYRLYSASQMPKLNRIISLKSIGFSLDEVTLVLDKGLTTKEIHTLLEIKCAEVREKVKHEQIRLSRLETMIKLYQEEAYNMTYNIVLKEIESLKVASTRAQIPSPSDQGHLWEILVEHIGKYKVKIVPPCMVIFHSSDKKDGIDVEVIEPIEGALPETDKINVGMLEGVKSMACVVHEGSCNNLHLAYQAITKWTEENNYVIDGPHRELYLKGEWNAESEDDYITEIQFPVRTN